MENTKTNITLTKQDTKFKCHITSELEAKIRYMCRKFPKTEWSGILLYTLDNPETLEVTCRDFLLMDIGSSTYTEYEFDNTIAEFYAENLDKLHYMSSLVHSHHSMQTFFSGTDLETLKEFGSKYNIFLSLIVNNEGTYSVAITTKEERTFTGKVKTTYYSPKEGAIEEESEIEYSQIEVYYIMGDIDIEMEQDNVLQERIKELSNKKKNVPSSPYTKPFFEDSRDLFSVDYFPKENTSPKVYELNPTAEALFLLDAIIQGNTYTAPLYDDVTEETLPEALEWILEDLKSISKDEIHSNIVNLYSEDPNLFKQVPELVEILTPYRKSSKIAALINILENI